jgi:hypothetical protein
MLQTASLTATYITASHAPDTQSAVISTWRGRTAANSPYDHPSKSIGRIQADTRSHGITSREPLTGRSVRIARPLSNDLPAWDTRLAQAWVSSRGRQGLAALTDGAPGTCRKESPSCYL